MGLLPDEIMFNSLLDGCAQQNRVDQAKELLIKMEKLNIPPSNFTVCILVKLMNKAHRLDEAFEISERLCKKYDFKPNVYVCTNLMQACIAHRDLERALKVLDDMCALGVAPDGRIFTVGIRACLNPDVASAEQLLRSGFGLTSGRKGVPMPNDEKLDRELVSEILIRLDEEGYSKRAKDLIADLENNSTVWIDQHIRKRIGASKGERQYYCPSQSKQASLSYNTKGSRYDKKNAKGGQSQEWNSTTQHWRGKGKNRRISPSHDNKAGLKGSKPHNSHKAVDDDSSVETSSKSVVHGRKGPHTYQGDKETSKGKGKGRANGRPFRNTKNH